MKPFESFLGPKMEEYVHYRDTLGYRTKNVKSYLLNFDQYVRKMHGHWDSLQPLFFLGFRQSIKGEPSTINKTVRTVRGFFQFLVRQDIIEENPLRDIPSLRELFFIPFIFSEQETERLMKAVMERVRKSPRHFLKDLAVYLAILLMARCGLRISEPVHLFVSHFRPQERTLYIEKTKFKKDRLIPIPEALVRHITNYLTVRKSFQDEHNPYLLSGEKQTGVSKNHIYKVFHQAVKDCGLWQPRRVIGHCIFGSPIPHSLRHSFAVNTLKRIKEQGKSPQAALPVLATYMGHSNYHYTAVYLKVLDAQQRKGLIDFRRSHQGKR